MAKAGTAVAHAKVQLPADIKAGFASEIEAMQKRIGAPSGNRIKVTQKKTFRMPSGEENAGPIVACIVDFASANYFYQGVYDPDDILPPDCFALGTEVATMAPHDTVAANMKQASTCALCPQNQWGSAERGKGKACSNTRLLALLAPDANAETPIMVLRVSATGLRPFDAYVGSIARTFQTPPIAVFTSISFDPALDYPSLRFGEPEPVNAEFFQLAMSRRTEAQRILTTPPDTSGLRAQPVQQPVKGRSRRAAA